MSAVTCILVIVLILAIIFVKSKQFHEERIFTKKSTTTFVPDKDVNEPLNQGDINNHYNCLKMHMLMPCENIDRFEHEITGSKDNIRRENFYSTSSNGYDKDFKQIDAFPQNILCQRNEVQNLSYHSYSGETDQDYKSMAMTVNRNKSFSRGHIAYIAPQHQTKPLHSFKTLNYTVQEKVSMKEITDIKISEDTYNEDPMMPNPDQDNNSKEVRSFHSSIKKPNSFVKDTKCWCSLGSEQRKVHFGKTTNVDCQNSCNETNTYQNNARLLVHQNNLKREVQMMDSIV